MTISPLPTQHGETNSKSPPRRPVVIAVSYNGVPLSLGDILCFSSSSSFFLRCVAFLTSAVPPPSASAPSALQEAPAAFTAGSDTNDPTSHQVGCRDRRRRRRRRRGRWRRRTAAGAAATNRGILCGDPMAIWTLSIRPFTPSFPSGDPVRSRFYPRVSLPPPPLFS